MGASPLAASMLAAPLAQRPILVLEDDEAIATTICAALERDGWNTVTATTLAGGRQRLQDDNPRLLIVDLGLPDGNGIAFVRQAASLPDLGIIVVSGRSAEVDRVVGLEVGADDYLAKPFSLREMVARVRALSRRLDAIQTFAPPALPPPAFAQQPAATRPRAEAEVPAAGEAARVSEPASWTIAGLTLQPARQRLLGPGTEETRLTGGEAGLLHLLLTGAGHLATRTHISESVLGRKLLPEQRGVDQLASNLRQKLLAASTGRITITAQRGKGYRLVW
ncbi:MULTISPECIES: response regulator transcription factor [Roseomonadaceae]|uniref:Response regulator transcription factor n=1 Tax=Falsiroseomonas oleicola TaxID=2801474 RepID=A0ABS6HE33_9PROT|nr:response regulator transcription factor [Roseomonas oleicola]MBU8546606.1 response regulator transcription factor [Roseomonas oleicola]